MKKIEPRFLKNEEIKRVLEITKEEKDALSAYKGVWTYKYVNELLGVYIPDEMENPNGYKSNHFGSNPKENIKHYMDIIEKMYSYMYKSTVESYSTYGEYASIRVGRGASVSLLSQENTGFISTSTLDQSGRVNQYQESINWAISNNRNSNRHVLSKISVNSDVPHLHVDYEDGGNQGEREVIISPFASIEKDEWAGRFSNGERKINGIRIEEEYVNIKRTKLKQLSKEEQQKLEGELLSQADLLESKTLEYAKDSKEYEKLLDEWKKNKNIIQSLNIEFSQARRMPLGEKSDKAIRDIRDDLKFVREKDNEIDEDMNETLKRMNKNKGFITEWKTKFRILMEARCADIEMDIDASIDNAIGNTLQHEADVERMQKEERQKREDKINSGFKSGELHSQKLKQLVAKIETSDTMRGLITFQKGFDLSGIRYLSPLDQVRHALNELKINSNIKFVGEETNREFESRNNHGMTLEDNIQIVQQHLQLEENDIKNQMANNYKSAVMENVLQVRARQEYRKLLEQKECVQNRRIGIFDRKRKEEEKQSELNAINQKVFAMQDFVRTVKSNGLDLKCKYSAREIMGEINIALNGSLSDEERRLIEDSKNKLNKSFAISESGVKQFMQQYEMDYGNDNSSQVFLNRYGGIVNQKQMQVPQSKIASEIISVNNRLREINNKSNIEYTKLSAQQHEYGYLNR